LRKTAERKSIIKVRIARTLLNNPEGDLTKYRVAKLAQTKYPRTHQILKKLEIEGIVRRTKVKDYDRLISLWQKWRINPDRRDYMVKDPLQVIRHANLEYALTTYQAENKIQNYLFPTRTDFYVKVNDKLKWHKLISKEGLVGKGNTRMLIGEEHVFYKSFEVDGLRIVSSPQLIIDLLTEGSVCVEAAEMLLKKVKKNALRELRN